MSLENQSATGRNEDDLSRVRSLTGKLLEIREKLSGSNDEVDSRLLGFFIYDEKRNPNEKILPTDIQKEVEVKIASSQAWLREYIARTLFSGSSLDPEQKLTPEQAAEAIGVSLSLIYSLCGEKLLTHYRLGGKGKRGKVLITRKDLEIFFESRRVEAIPEANENSQPESEESTVEYFI